jgi:hypothetical protein
MQITAACSSQPNPRSNLAYALTSEFDNFFCPTVFHPLHAAQLQLKLRHTRLQQPELSVVGHKSLANLLRQRREFLLNFVVQCSCLHRYLAFYLLSIPLILKSCYQTKSVPTRTLVATLLNSHAGVQVRQIDHERRIRHHRIENKRRNLAIDCSFCNRSLRIGIIAIFVIHHC